MGELEAESELKETIRTRVRDLETASRELAGGGTTYLRFLVAAVRHTDCQSLHPTNFYGGFLST